MRHPLQVYRGYLMGLGAVAIKVANEAWDEGFELEAKVGSRAGWDLFGDGLYCPSWDWDFA